MFILIRFFYWFSEMLQCGWIKSLWEHWDINEVFFKLLFQKWGAIKLFLFQEVGCEDSLRAKYWNRLSFFSEPLQYCYSVKLCFFQERSEFYLCSKSARLPGSILQKILEFFDFVWIFPVPNMPGSFARILQKLSGF